MTIHVEVTQLESRFDDLLDRVTVGEEVEITTSERVVARLVPVRDPRALRGSLIGTATTTAPDEALLSTGATRDPE